MLSCTAFGVLPPPALERLDRRLPGIADARSVEARRIDSTNQLETPNSSLGLATDILTLCGREDVSNLIVVIGQPSDLTRHHGKVTMETCRVSARGGCHGKAR